MATIRTIVGGEITIQVERCMMLGRSMRCLGMDPVINMIQVGVDNIVLADVQMAMRIAHRSTGASNDTSDTNCSDFGFIYKG